MKLKNGELFEGNTLDRIRPSEKKLPPLWWWASAPTEGTEVREDRR